MVKKGAAKQNLKEEDMTPLVIEQLRQLRFDLIFAGELKRCVNLFEQLFGKLEFVLIKEDPTALVLFTGCGEDGLFHLGHFGEVLPLNLTGNRDPDQDIRKTIKCKRQHRPWSTKLEAALLPAILGELRLIDIKDSRGVKVRNGTRVDFVRRFLLILHASLEVDCNLIRETGILVWWALHKDTFQQVTVCKYVDEFFKREFVHGLELRIVIAWFGGVSMGGVWPEFNWGELWRPLYRFLGTQNPLALHEAEAALKSETHLGSEGLVVIFF